MTLIDFMNEDFYRDYLLTVDEKLSKKIDIEAEVPEVVIKVQTEFLEKAELSLSDLKWLIENYRDETARYMAKKYDFYLEPDGGKEGIVNKPPRKNFPIGHLIEYFLILNNPEKLFDYVRSIRMPNAKK